VAYNRPVALASFRSSCARWAPRLGLIVYVALLSTSLLTPAGRAGVAGAGLLDLRTGARIRTVALALAVYALVEVVRFVPVGILAVLSTPRARGDRTRVLLLAAAAGVGSLVITGLVLAREIGWQWPGPSDLVLPVMGCAVGVGTCLAWRGGRIVWRRSLMMLVVLLLAVPLVAGMTLLAASEREPLVRESPAVTSEEKRRLFTLLRRENPNKLAPVETRTLSLASRDLDLLLAWGLPVLLGDGRAAARIDLESPPVAILSLSFRLPGGARYLNLVAGARVAIDNAKLTLGDPRLRIGRLTLPGALLRRLSPIFTALIQAERRARPVLAGVERLDIGPGRVSVTYGHMDLPPRLLAGLIWGEGSNEEMRQAVKSHVARLLHATPHLPDGERRLGAAVEVAFAWARERSATGSPVLENRAALLTLGILLGHPRLAGLVGPVVEGRDWPRAVPLARATLRGRNDWAKHFFVSAALTVLSAQAPSDAIGLFKEELDAGGGSGFSFGDLMADRAGTTFALLATGDEAAARALQERLAAGFRVDDFFPEAADLPEDIQDAELQSRYGGVGGPLFRTYAAEVERRLWNCPAYRALARAR
jgi:hypothetical protein